MKHPTQAIIDIGIKTEPEVQNSQWQMVDDGGVEVEVGEFLYGLVRMIKPRRILETGLYSAVSAMYMALALRDNGFGHLDEIEWESIHIARSKERLVKLGVQNLVTIYQYDSRTFETQDKYELMFLDTEPQYRFSELNHYWKNLVPGGIVLIHDLHNHLGKKQEPWEDFEKLIGDKIKDRELEVIPFPTPRGLVMLRKAHNEDGVYKMLKGIK